MPQQRSATLDDIQIRYRIPYLTWLRMKAWAKGRTGSLSYACAFLLCHALDDLRVTADPAVLLGLQESKPE